MKILMVNKFLFPNGGSETYVFKLGDFLQVKGHEVQYFGMEDERRCVGNAIGVYTANMDFHDGFRSSRLTYPIRTIYSSEARKKIRMILEDFQPDVVHLNNFNYQLTPSIILEIHKWRKQKDRKCRIVFTAHDYQLICPNHMLNNPITHENCEKCLGGHFVNCIKGKCIHGSVLKSLVGMAEAVFWNSVGVYKYIDVIICCSGFMKKKMDTNPVLAGKTITLHNFVDKIWDRDHKERDEGYVLYFGRFSAEKGIGTLIKVCKELPEIPFVFAGSGPLEKEINALSNVENVGFQTGEGLRGSIRKAKFSVYPSEWFENCPFSVMESLMCGTPVIGSDIGGIPELIEDGKTGELFESGDVVGLKHKIQKLWNEENIVAEYSKNCSQVSFDPIEQYYEKIMRIYTSGQG